jgi:hypothetical protein
MIAILFQIMSPRNGTRTGGQSMKLDRIARRTYAAAPDA